MGQSRKRVYTCQYCGKEIIGYKKHHDHERRFCLKRPDDSDIPDISNSSVQEPVPEATEDITDDTDLFEAFENDVPERPDTIPPELWNAFLDMSNKIDRRFEKLEEKFGAELMNAIQNIQVQADRIPEIVRMSLAGHQVPETPMEAPAPPPENGSYEDITGMPQQPQQPRRGGGVLQAISSQINWGEIILAWLRSQGGGDLNAALAKLIFSGGNKPKAPDVDAKYMSRGMGHALSMIRMKSANPDMQAISIKAAAEEMLRERGLSKDMRGYYVGQKAAAESYLQGRDLERQVASSQQTEGNSGVS